MRITPQTVQNLHFVGIGGIGMSGIAEVLHNLGYKVTGSDMSENNNTNRLQKMGIHIHIGHQANNVTNAQVVVVSSAVSSDNPEVIQAKEKRIPVIQRAEMLAELMRLKHSIAISGTHGKTTTTSLAACLLDAAGLDPTVVNGGILNAYNTNARLGSGPWTVVEADESDGSFMKLPATLVVVTNIDPEHMEFYGTLETLQSSFLKFVQNIPFYGLAICCVDHPVVADLVTQIHNRRVVTYGFSEHAMVRAVNVRLTQEGSTFDVEIAGRLPAAVFGHVEGIVQAMPKRMKDIYLPMVGQHNVQNALSIIAIALELGLGEDVVKKAFASFKGVKRRFTRIGESGGITIIDDYAHHPVEIETVLKAAKQATKGKIIAVVQPHRYTRVRDLFSDFSSCFDGADAIVVAPIYSAGENPLDGITSQALAQAIRMQTKASVYEIQEQKELAYLISRIAKSGDMVVCMGAGSITYWASTLPAQLDSLSFHSIDEGCSNQLAS
jgi:UDP-N-acetylmuramate--alanine ligase